MVKYCHHCGSEIKDNEKFCSKCGKKAINLNPNYERADSEDIPTDFNSPRHNDNNFNSSDFQDSGSNFNNSNFNKDSHSKNNKKSSKSHSTTLMKIVILICLILISIVLLYGLYPDLIEDIGGIENIDFNDGDNEPSIQNQTSHYTIDLENGAYLSGEGKSKMIDSNYSVIESYENFTVSGYEAFEIELDNGSWYIITLYKVDYNEPSSDWVYNSDIDDNGEAYVFFNSKGEYYGYFINIPNSSDNYTYQRLDFLTSIFHFNH